MSAIAQFRFEPHRLLRNAHLQSMLASSAVRRAIDARRHAGVIGAEQALILDCGEGVRLGAFHNAARRDDPRGLVVLIHGWEGSAQSAYVLNVAARLLDEGYATVRLNLRDHGGTHHLNPGIFHSCRIDEVVGAFAALARLLKLRPFYAVGFSLGGNFALRVALRAPARAIPLDAVLAVCPAIHPPHVLESLESGTPIYHAYFMNQWRESLRRKQATFADDYAFPAPVFKLSMRELTRYLIEHHTEFESLDAYLNGYSIAGGTLRGLEVPTAVLTARDDPIIPVSDFESLALPRDARLDITAHGGHCGFVADFSLKSLAEDWISARLSEFAE